MAWPMLQPQYCKYCRESGLDTVTEGHFKCIYILNITTSVSVDTADHSKQLLMTTGLRTQIRLFCIFYFFKTKCCVKIMRVLCKNFNKIILVRNGYFLFLGTKITISPRYLRHILPCQDVCCSLMAKYLHTHISDQKLYFFSFRLSVPACALF